MILHFLESPVPLTKTYVKTAAGLAKTPYPFVWEFTSHDVTVASLQQLEACLIAHAARGHCLLKGTLLRPLVHESRAGSTNRGDATEFIVLDLDGLPDNTAGVDGLLQALGLGDVSYVIQWSASYGIENRHLRAHIFMLLDKPMAAPLLKQWLIQLNHTTPMLHNAMGLTKTGNAVSWPLDISACQNDKLIYIAPPVLKGIKDPLAGKPRIQLVKRKLDRLSLGATINSTTRNRALTDKRLDELRDAAGLPKRKTTYKMHGSIEVLVKPDSATITESKIERGFVYFNLNGGDSWAYYHPENNPDYIHNFKGEPSYLTKELLPEYWEQLHNQVNVAANSRGLMYLAFCDRKTSAYWRGTYDTVADVLDIHQAKNETQVRHFAKQVGMPLGEFIPEWDLTFDPHDNVRVDPQNRTVNLFTPTQYMRSAASRPTLKPVPTPPKVIAKVINHALGGDPLVVDHFMNWLAFIIQERDRTTTAWVLHGTQGTGKGLLMNRILRPMLGANQTTARRMEEFNEAYNHFMRNSFIVFVDEVETKALQNERGVIAKLKNFITEEYVAIRTMYAVGIEARNYTNWIFASNKPDPVSIDREDRRFNVGKYQPARLDITDRELDQIPKELQGFYDYLMTYKVNKDRARSVLNTADRETMISISESSADTVAGALLQGRFSFFMDQLPDNDAWQGNTLEFNRVENYKETLKTLLARTDRNSGKCSVSRDELRVLFDYTVGNMPTSPNKFTSLLKHHRIHTTKVWIPSKAVYGIQVCWRDLAQWGQYLKTFTPAPAPGKKSATKKLAVVV